MDSVALTQQERKGTPSKGEDLLRFTGINYSKSQQSFVTSANNSWQLKKLNNSLSTCSSLWREPGGEIQRESPSMERLEIRERLHLMCV